MKVFFISRGRGACAPRYFSRCLPAIRYVLLSALLAFRYDLPAQIPVEIFGGEKKASFDLMFFKFFKNKEGENSKILFFSRERVVLDYNPANPPQFGFTEALSYNHPALKGFGPVLVGQALNRGAFAKTGLQYARVTKTTTLFGWSVVELNRKPDIDLFLLIRYTPGLGKKWHLFSQIESINTLPTQKTTDFSFVQRLRIGLKNRDWQFGIGGDFAETGRKTHVASQNIGLFLRHEFF